MKSEFNKGIVEGALMLAAWMVVALITALTPFALATGLLLPVPFVVLTVRRGLGVSSLAGVLAFVAPLLVGIDIARALSMALLAVLPGLALGEGYRRHLRPTMTFAFGVGGYLISVFLMMNLLSLFLGINLVTEALTLMQRSTVFVVEILSRFQLVPPEALENLFRDWLLLEASAVFLLPGLVLVGVTITTFALQNISQLVLNRLGMKVDSFPPFVTWRFGDWFLWLFVFSLVLRFVGWRLHPLLMVIGYSTFSPLFYGLVIQGLAVSYWWLRKLKFKILRVAPLLLVVHPFAFMVFSLIGIADFLMNFRRL